MALAEIQKKKFEALRLAFARDEVCLVEGYDKKTGEPIDLLCAVGQEKSAEGPMVTFTPLAEMSRYNLGDRFGIKDLGDGVEDVVSKGG